MDQDAASRMSSDDPPWPGQQPPENPESPLRNLEKEIVDEAEKRRERKRFTDRVAQRQHRKRQKLHIEELEAQLRALKSGGHTEVAQLTAQNARLYDELKQVYGLWDEMEDLLRRQRLLRQNSALQLTRGPTSPRPDPHGSTVGEGVATQNVMSELSLDLMDGRPARPIDSNTQQPADTEFTSMEVTHDSEDKEEPAAALGEPGLASSNNVVASQVCQSQWAPPHDTSGDMYQLCQTLPTPGSSSQPVPGTHTSHAQLPQVGEPRVGVDSEAFDTIDWAQIYQQLDSSLSNMPSHGDHAGPQAPTHLHRAESCDKAALRPLPESCNAILESGNSREMNTWSSCYGHHLGRAPSLNTQLPTNSSPLTSAGPKPSGNDTSQCETTPTSPRHSIESILGLLGAYVGQWIPPPSPISMSIPVVTMPKSQSLPLFLVPPLPRDKEVHAILDRARVNISSIGPPSLSDFLFDNPKNTLSIDLKTLLAPVRQARRTSEFLSAYWIMYLLFRWQVIQDESAYQSVPSWLRPTQLQLTVPHPVAADLVPWPEIREELIHMSLIDETGPYDVSFDIIRHMTVDIQTLDHAGLKDPTRLEAAISDLKNWNLSEGFFDRYPQWKSLNRRNGSLRPHSTGMETIVV